MEDLSLAGFKNEVLRCKCPYIGDRREPCPPHGNKEASLYDIAVVKDFNERPGYGSFAIPYRNKWPWVTRFPSETEKKVWGLLSHLSLEEVYSTTMVKCPIPIGSHRAANPCMLKLFLKELAIVHSKAWLFVGWGTRVLLFQLGFNLKEWNQVTIPTEKGLPMRMTCLRFQIGPKEINGFWIASPHCHPEWVKEASKYIKENGPTLLA